MVHKLLSSMEHASKAKAKVVVGFDFGTTFSGFAYARVADPTKIHNFYEWPDCGAAGGRNYCKTATALLYSGEKNYDLQDWGYSATLKYAAESKLWSRRKATSSSLEPRLVTKFKLYLAAANYHPGFVEPLPSGIDSRRAVSDYLFKMSQYALQKVRSNMGNYISMKDIQWCLTVPAIWDEQAKQEMKTCAEIAGMVRGPACTLEGASSHELLVVLEPEAASIYCHEHVLDFPKDEGDKFLIVDTGGGTVDLVLHEKVSSKSLQVRELKSSAGGLCGGTFVDDQLWHFLSKKISCFKKYAEEHMDSLLQLKGIWESHKYGFDGNVNTPYFLDLPPRLAKLWESVEPGHDSEYYDVVELSVDDMKKIFDPVIGDILRLIERMLVPDLKAIVLVGGFSGSPYLEKKIREKFSSRAGMILKPHEPGCAICCGAVIYGIRGPDIILSRISRKTYGVKCTRLFRVGDPLRHMFQSADGEANCSNVFDVYTTKGDVVPLSHCVRNSYSPVEEDQTTCIIELYSTTRTDAKFVTQEGLQKEGNFKVKFPSAKTLLEAPTIEVSMFFGRSMVEVTAIGQNFGDGEKFEMEPVRFEKTFDDSAADEYLPLVPVEV